MNGSGAGKLRVGLLLDSMLVHAWVYKTIELIDACGYAEVVLVVRNNTEVKHTGRLAYLFQNPKNILFKLYRIYDNKVWKSHKDAFEIKDASLLLGDAENISITPTSKKFIDIIDEGDVELIKSKSLDVLVRFGFRILKGGILKAARYGVWSYHHGDNQFFRGSPAGSWEVLEEFPSTGAILQVLSEDLDAGLVLYKSVSQTRNGIAENMDSLFWKSALFLPRTLSSLAQNPAGFFAAAETVNQSPSFYSRRLFKTPDNRTFIRLFAKRIFRKIKTKFNSVFYTNQWVLLYAINKKKAPVFSLYKFKKMLPPKDRFWADPFIVEENSQYYIFIEELEYKTQKGHISVIQMDGTGKYGPAKKVLELPYHLSYPYVFKEGGKYYMIPESASNKTIDIYEAVNFPYQWQALKPLMSDIEAVDTTLLHHEGRWWLFANVSEIGVGNTLDELFLFYADDFLSDNWTAHPMNPIVSDVRIARPAGKIFELNGSLYRPSQINAPNYGRGISVNRIIELTETSYKEEAVTAIHPEWDKAIIGAHTLAHEGQLTIIDALYKRRK